MKLEPYLTFNGEGIVIGTKIDNLWSDLQADFYSKRDRDRRIKRLPKKLLDNLTDLHSLATFYMDDGSLLLSTQINHNQKKIYITPHIALYLQSFTFDELSLLKEQIKKLTAAEFILTKIPSENGYYLRTSRTADTLLFLQDIDPVTITCPAMSYKTNWQYRFYIEKQKWHCKYSDYQLLTSSRERRRPYTQDEIQTIKHMKQCGKTDQQIADLLERSYWSIVIGNETSEMDGSTCTQYFFAN